jgi:hypothetical protein
MFSARCFVYVDTASDRVCLFSISMDICAAHNRDAMRCRVSCLRFAHGFAGKLVSAAPRRWRDVGARTRLAVLAGAAGVQLCARPSRQGYTHTWVVFLLPFILRSARRSKQTFSDGSTTRTVLWRAWPSCEVHAPWDITRLARPRPHLALAYVCRSRYAAPCCHPAQNVVHCLDADFGLQIDAQLRADINGLYHNT